MRVARWFFYLYFSLAAGMFVAGTLTLVIGLTWSTNVNLPGGGEGLWLATAAFIAMALVFGQWDHFGERIRVGRWVLLCVTATLLGVAGFGMSSLWAL